MRLSALAIAIFAVDGFACLSPVGAPEDAGTGDAGSNSTPDSSLLGGGPQPDASVQPIALCLRAEDYSCSYSASVTTLTFNCGAGNFSYSRY